MRVIVIANEVPNRINSFFTISDDDFVIAVDGALTKAHKQKIKVDLVIGDFDSIKTKKRLSKYKKIVLNEEKDDTDTKVAIEEAYKISNEVYLIGGIKGDRIEHFLANLYLLNKFPNLIIMNENSTIYLLREGKHLLEKKGYISLFALKDSVITLTNFKYPLHNYNIKVYDTIGISNEILNVYGEINVTSGSIIVISSKK